MTWCTISKQDFCLIFPSDGHKPAVPNLKLWFGSNRFELRQSSLKQQPGQDWRCTCWMISSRASTGKCSNKFFTAVAFPPTKWEDFGFSALYLRITPGPSVSPQDRKVSRLCTRRSFAETSSGAHTEIGQQFLSFRRNSDHMGSNAPHRSEQLRGSLECKKKEVMNIILFG